MEQQAGVEQNDGGRRLVTVDCQQRLWWWWSSEGKTLAEVPEPEQTPHIG